MPFRMTDVASQISKAIETGDYSTAHRLCEQVRANGGIVRVNLASKAKEKTKVWVYGGKQK